MQNLSLQILFNTNVSFQSCLCDDCHDLLKKAMNFNKIATASVKKKYIWIFLGTGRNEAINIMKKTDLNEKSNYVNDLYLREKSQY